MTQNIQINMKNRYLQAASVFVIGIILSLMLSLQPAKAYNNTWTVSVSNGYLALRTAKAYNYNNEIGCLYTGDVVDVYDTSDSVYWYVYSPKYGREGYVNKNYLYCSSSSSNSYSSGNYGTGTAYGPTYYVTGIRDGYLALRTAKAYDYRNEIGCLYNGDSVYLVDSSDYTYWYVYSPKHGKYGYVNRNYLY